MVSLRKVIKDIMEVQDLEVEIKGLETIVIKGSITQGMIKVIDSKTEVLTTNNKEVTVLRIIKEITLAKEATDPTTTSRTKILKIVNSKEVSATTIGVAIVTIEAKIDMTITNHSPKFKRNYLHPNLLQCNGTTQ